MIKLGWSQLSERQLQLAVLRDYRRTISSEKCCDESETRRRGYSILKRIARPDVALRNREEIRTDPDVQGKMIHRVNGLLGAHDSSDTSGIIANQFTS